jgi:hypothetical protein
VVVLNGSANTVSGGAGNDKIYDLSTKGGNQLNGDAGNDYIKGVGNSAVHGGAGTDECYTGDNGSITGCELPKVSFFKMIMNILGL